MPIYQMTYEKIEELKKLEDMKQAEYNRIEQMKPEDIWKDELVELLEALKPIASTISDISNTEIVKKKVKKTIKK
jgi:hypothetical protein